MTNAPSSREFFEAKYQDAADPWEFATSRYELGRYDQILKTLHGRQYKRVFEPGCSVGVLTQRLAAITDSLYASDTSDSAVARARERCRLLTHVTVTQGELPQDMPESSFDLIVFSEMGYYFEESALASLARTLVGHLESGGVLLAAHWLGESPDHKLSGDRVHEILSESFDNLKLTSSKRHPRYLIDRWEKP